MTIECPILMQDLAPSQLLPPQHDFIILISDPSIDTTSRA